MYIYNNIYITVYIYNGIYIYVCAKPMLKSPEFDINALGTGVNSFTGMKHQEFPQHSPAPDHLCDLTMDRLGQTSNDSETARFPLRHGCLEHRKVKPWKIKKWGNKGGSR